LLERGSHVERFLEVIKCHAEKITAQHSFKETSGPRMNALTNLTRRRVHFQLVQPLLNRHRVTAPAEIRIQTSAAINSRCVPRSITWPPSTLESVGVTHRRKPMRDHKARALRHQPLQRFLISFSVAVSRSRSPRPKSKSAGLSTAPARCSPVASRHAEFHAALAHTRIVLLRQLHDELVKFAPSPRPSSPLVASSGHTKCFRESCR